MRPARLIDLCTLVGETNPEAMSESLGHVGCIQPVWVCVQVRFQGYCSEATVWFAVGASLC